MWTYADCHKLEEFIGNKSLFIRIKTEKFIKKREKASTTYPQQCADVFWLHMQRKRGGREGERQRFFSFFPFFSIPSSIYQKVWFDSRFFFFFFFPFSSFELDTSVTTVAIVDVHTLMTISDIVRLCVEACLTYKKLQVDWMRGTM